jgi:hypothetical protein
MDPIHILRDGLIYGSYSAGIIVGGLVTLGINKSNGGAMGVPHSVYNIS